MRLGPGNYGRQLLARYRVNNSQAALGMTIEGVGISLLPSFIGDPEVRSNALKVVLPAWSRIPMPVHAVFASSRYMSPKVRAFVNLSIDGF
ncbi:MAG: LysR substrate-binding domain-containing protein [Burkholderiaceae bacterium]